MPSRYCLGRQFAGPYTLDGFGEDGVRGRREEGPGGVSIVAVLDASVSASRNAMTRGSRLASTSASRVTGAGAAPQFVTIVACASGEK